MAITPLRPATEPVSSPDAYPCGWRDVPIRGADGRLDYHQIPLTYVIVDAVRGSRLVTPRLIDDRLAEGGYRHQPPDSQTRPWLEAARRWLGVVDDEIVCFDEADQPLADDQTQARALEHRWRAFEEELRRRG